MNLSKETYEFVSHSLPYTCISEPLSPTVAVSPFSPSVALSDEELQREGEREGGGGSRISRQIVRGVMCWRQWRGCGWRRRRRGAR